MLCDANVPVRLRAQQRANYSSPQFTANCIGAILCQTDFRITNQLQWTKISTVVNVPFIQNSNRMTFSFDHNRKFFKHTRLSTPAVFKASSKLFGSQGCSWQKLPWFFEHFLKDLWISQFNSAFAVSFQLKSSLTVAWFSWTNHNSLLRIATSEIASF